MRTTSIFTAVLACAIAQAASAKPSDPKLVTTMGVEASIGGGVSGFTEKAMADVTDPGGGWTARLTFGTRSYLAGELAYVGTAQNINAIGMDSGAILLANGVEGALRLNFIDRGMWQPYAFAGIAWKRYDLVNTDTNTSSVLDRDDVGEVPVGAGMAFRYAGFVADARVEFRPAFSNDLMAVSATDNAQLHTWAANARLGWEF